jgi:DNA polymerase-3 subunit delta
VKASKASIGRSVDQPDPRTRFYLFYGPDESQARALGARLAAALGASKLAVSGGEIKANPGVLATEASAMSLFGERRAIWIEPAGDDIAEGVESLLQANGVESPVIAIGGPLRKTSALVKLAESSPLALAYAAYLPEGQDAERMVIDLGRTLGLKISAPVAARIADSSGGDQAIVSQELHKFALYADASPHTPKELDHHMVDAVGADSSEGDFLKLADLALRGHMEALGEELARLPSGGAEAIPVIRSLQRRLLMLGPIRAQVERGERIDAVMASAGRSLFWKDKPLVEAMLKRWSAEDLAKATERCGALERELMFTDAPEREALGEELIAIARKARRR